MNEGRPVPVVRDEHGAILGADYRQTDLAPEGVRVPGRVSARVVMPGDTIRVEWTEADQIVHRVVKDDDVVRLIAGEHAGDLHVFVRSLDDLVDVVAVGAFER